MSQVSVDNLRKKDLSRPEDWHGLWTALVTPLSRQGEALVLDKESLRSLIEDQISRGVDGFVIAGSTGEGSLLGPTLYSELLTQARETVMGRVPLVAGLGIGGTVDSVRNATLAKTLGYEGVLASAPAYIKTPQRGLVEHFLAVARVGLPVCLYEVPGRAASSISVETLAELLAHPDPAARQFLAIKDATGDLSRAMQESQFCKGRAALLSGDDPTFFPFLKCGGVGAISVASHILPEHLRLILELAQKNEDAQGVIEQSKINPFVSLLFHEANPIPVKSLLASMGLLKEAAFCPPLVPLKGHLLKELQEAQSALRSLA